MVETALVLPLVVLLALVVVQIGLVVRDQVLVVHAAREAARQAAVDGDGGAIRRAAITAGALAADRLSVDVGARGAPGTQVRVEVAYRAPTDVPLVGAVVGDVTLSAAASMRVEQ